MSDGMWDQDSVLTLPVRARHRLAVEESLFPGPAVRVESRHSPFGSVRLSRSPDDRRMPMHGHSCAHLAVVLEGRMIEEDPAGTVLESVAGDVLFYPAGYQHEVLFAVQPTQVLSVNLGPCALKEYGLQGSDSMLRTQIAEPERTRLVALTRSDTADHSDQVCIAQLFDRLLSDFTCSHDRPDWLESIRRLLDGNLEEVPTLRELAAAAGRHPNYVSQMFHRYFGVPISRYVRRRRLISASLSLVSDGLSMTEAAHQAGFSDTSHFLRTFKAVSHVTAGVFRRSEIDVREVCLPRASQ